jgi:hypothetical protein
MRLLIVRNDRSRHNIDYIDLWNVVHVGRQSTVVPVGVVVEDKTPSRDRAGYVLTFLH